jgi:hypothetical protein
MKAVGWVAMTLKNRRLGRRHPAYKRLKITALAKENAEELLKIFFCPLALLS